MRPEDMIGALDQQRPEVDIASLGDAELRVVVPGLAASRQQAQITAHIATSLEAFPAAQCQDIRRHDHLVDHLLKLFADPDRVRSSSIAIRALAKSVNHFSTPEGGRGTPKPGRRIKLFTRLLTDKKIDFSLG